MPIIGSREEQRVLDVKSIYYFKTISNSQQYVIQIIYYDRVDISQVGTENLYSTFINGRR